MHGHTKDKIDKKERNYLKIQGNAEDCIVKKNTSSEEHKGNK